MTLQEAREAYMHWDRLVAKFPANHAINMARAIAYEQWLRVVRYWKLTHG